MAEIERVEYALFWADDEEDPFVIYEDEEEAIKVAEASSALVLRRVLVIERVGDWEPNERQPNREGT